MPRRSHAIHEAYVFILALCVGLVEEAASGISIPISYTAHLAPISSAKLHAEVTASTRPASAAETAYVVMMSQVNVLSADGGGISGRCGERVQQCWQFEHPRRDLILDSSGEYIRTSYWHHTD
jgi:protein arginine N-methyltransferase 5